MNIDVSKNLTHEEREQLMMIPRLGQRGKRTTEGTVNPRVLDTDDSFGAIPGEALEAGQIGILVQTPAGKHLTKEGIPIKRLDRLQID